MKKNSGENFFGHALKYTIFTTFCMTPASGHDNEMGGETSKNTIFIELCMNPASGVSSKWVRNLIKKNTNFIQLMLQRWSGSNHNYEFGEIPRTQLVATSLV